jgi:hypothetical protein
MANVQPNDDDAAPGTKRWLISCDESGVNGTRYYGFGSLWMAWQRRGDFASLIQSICDDHGYTHEVKWTKVKSQTRELFTDLVEAFFREPWLSFHCVLVEKAVVKKHLHAGGFDEARRKHLTMLLKNKIQICMKAHPGRSQTFRVWTDPIPSRYEKAHEAIEVIANHALRKAFGGTSRPVDSVLVRDSKTTPSIQLCDLLLGAVASAWEGDAFAEAKVDLQHWIAYHLGWPDLKGDTRPGERKFNIWVFHDLGAGARKARTRDVSLVFPLPAHRKP